MKDESKSLLIMLIKASIVLFIVFLIIGFYIYYLKLSNYKENIKVQQRTEAIAIQSIIQKYISELKEDVKVYSSLPDVIVFLDSPDKKNTYILYKNISKLMTLRKYYSQFRLLNLKGMELFRINYSNGHTNLVPKIRLQDKNKRYYFKESTKLKKDEVYISPLDYNIENGVIEIPYQYTLRMLTPVYIDEKKKAYIAVNLNIDFFKNNFNIFKKISGFNIHIINDREKYFVLVYFFLLN